MRKFSTILLIISILVSVFDIIDTSDIMLGNKAAFSSTSNSDQDTTDDMDLDGLVFSHNILLFNLVDYNHTFVSFSETEVYYPATDQTLHEDYIQSLKKPPMA